MAISSISYSDLQISSNRPTSITESPRYSAKRMTLAGYSPEEMHLAGHTDIDISRAQKTIYLHIGYPKTGTSSLQYTMTDHAALIEETLGLKRLKTGSSDRYIDIENKTHEPANYDLFIHFYTASILGQDSNKEDFQHIWDDLKAEIDQSDRDRFFVSCELMSMQLEAKHIASIAKYLDDYQVKIILVTRDPLALFPSFYKTVLQVGHTNLTPSQFLKVIGDQLSYKTVSKRWARHFGDENMILIPYENIKGPKIANHFLSAIGFENELALPIPQQQKLPSLVLDQASVDYALKLIRQPVDRTSYTQLLRQISNFNIANNITENFLSDDDLIQLERIKLADETADEQQSKPWQYFFSLAFR